MTLTNGVGVIGYGCVSGLGVMVHDLRTQLGIAHQLVIPHGSYELVPEWAAGQTKSPSWEPDYDTLANWVHTNNLKVVLSVETFFGALTIERLKNLGVRTILLPMGEWFNAGDTQYGGADLYICNSQYTFDIVAPFRRVMIPWGVDLSEIPFRLRTGGAQYFIHNGGNLGVGGRKGTEASIYAFMSVAPGRTAFGDDPMLNAKLTVRAQRNPTRMPDHPAIRYEIGTVAGYQELYGHGDVLLYPSQLDGHALVTQEAMAAGMPVLTTDAAPMNEFHKEAGLEDLLIRVDHYGPSGTNNPNVQRAHVDVKDLADKIVMMASTDITAYSRRGRELIADRYTWDALRGRYLELISE